MTKRPKRPRDPLQLAKMIGDIATGQATDPKPDSGQSAAVEFARSGGLKGGKARAASLAPERRAEIAAKAAAARWGGAKKPK